MTPSKIEQLVERLIPEAELSPQSIDEVIKLPAFYTKMQACEKTCKTDFNGIDFALQDALVMRRLQQMVNTLMLNPTWKERLSKAGIEKAPENFEQWQQLPVSEKSLQAELFMGQRPGLVVPLSHGGFEIVASGGTSSGLPVETIYSLRELHDTYKIAGYFMGHHMLNHYLTEEGPKWLATTLADYQMWSSGTMVGGVLQHTPGINYIGAGPLLKETFQHMMSYPGQKAIMGISAGIALFTELGEGLCEQARNSFRVAMYGSGVLPMAKQQELKKLYPNLEILSYFAATQAETIGLQLDAKSPYLSAIPGLHLVEIVDENGQWVKEGEEGELLVTRLHAHEAPFIRYKVGDRMIRRENLDTDELKTIRFEFSGRSGDVLHLNDTQYSARQTYDALCRRLQAAGLFDLQKIAQEIQFVNHRKCQTLTLLVAADDCISLNKKITALGKDKVHELFTQALIGSLSLFNKGEANSSYLGKTGYAYEIKFLPKNSPDLFRTEVGKTPLLRDVF